MLWKGDVPSGGCSDRRWPLTNGRRLGWSRDEQVRRTDRTGSGERVRPENATPRAHGGRAGQGGDKTGGDRTGRDQAGGDARAVPWSNNSRRTPFEPPRRTDQRRPGENQVEPPPAGVPTRAGVVVVNDVRRVLLVWRHRLAAGGWGYEIPVGRVNAGDDAASAAARELEEVTGWRPGPLTPLLYLRPTDGLVPSRLHVFRAAKAFYAGVGADPMSGEHVEWVRMDQVRGLILRRRVVSPVTIAALLMANDT